jgi:hypothetical protein
MDSDQQPSVKRLSQEEYLVNDPLLKWAGQRKEALERRVAVCEDLLPILCLPIRRLARLKEHYTALAGDIAKSHSETTFLSKLPNAISVMDVIQDIADRDDLDGAPEWVRIAEERRRQEGGRNDLFSFMLGSGIQLQVDVKLDDIFRAALGPDPKPKVAAAPPEDAQALREDFQKPFLGHADEMLRLHVESQMNQGGNRELVYANVIPILQSSGSGKSKTVTQLSAKNLGLFVCVRAEGFGVVSQPPADRSVLQFLQEDPSSGGYLTYFRKTRIVAVWLLAMAEVMASFYEAEWQKYKQEHDSSREQEHDSNYGAFIAHVGDLLSPSAAPLSRGSTPPRKGSTPFSVNHRDRVLNAIAEKATALRKDRRYSTAQYKRRHRSRETGRKRKADDNTLNTTHDMGEDLDPTSDDTEYGKARPGPSNADGGIAYGAQLGPDELSQYSAAAEFFGNDLRTAFARLESRLPPEGKGSDGARRHFFHLAIDECGKMASRLAVIRRLWSLIGVSRCFLFLLDTNTQISLTYSQESVDSTFRMNTREKALLPPFTKFPYDLALRQDLSSYLEMVDGRTGATHADVSAWLRKMGRPLLNDYWLLDSLTGEPHLEKLSNKLLPHFPEEPFNEIQTSIALALHRMSLILVGRRGGQDVTCDYTLLLLIRTAHASHERRRLQEGPRG